MYIIVKQKTKDMHRLTVIGHLAADAKQIEGDNNFVVFTLIHSEKIRDKEITTSYDCYLSVQRGEKLMPYLTKGTKLFVEGRPSAKMNTHGDKHFINLSISVKQLELLRVKRE